MSALPIRTATKADLPIAVRLIGQLWEAHDEDDYDEESLTVRSGEILDTCDCYIIGDPAVAFASLQDAGDHMVVRHFAVEASERGAGVGRAAFETLEAHAFPGRTSRLYASITHTGPKAFWAKMGFEIYAYTMQRKGGT